MEQKGEITIIEKPDWVSWDEIKQCLFEAHAENRAKGINMAHYQWPAEKIKDSIGDKGIMLVALDGRKVVGTAALGDKFGKTWYANGRYGYMCFAGVLPEYGGKGIYNRLICERDRVALDLGYNVLVLDTHIENKIIQKTAIKNGYRYVRYFRAASKDHYSVVMAKWLDGYPYSKAYCWWKYYCSLVKEKTFSLYSRFKR